MTKLSEVQGIGETYAAKLNSGGIKTIEQLLAAGETHKGRKELSDKTGIGDALILKWVNHADLFRIKGVAGQYAELLEASGVDTVIELATRNPEHLLQKMEEINKKKNLVNRLPVLSMITDWVEQAKSLPRKIQY
jgi:predicted flap endonuclease-1-like 5' DNA nuclease